MSEQTIPLVVAYEIVLGGVMAISPELYAEALNRMAAMSGRENNDAFKADVAKISRSTLCDLD